jgi:uncharacterized protein YjbI with pentapeptide repeats
MVKTYVESQDFKGKDYTQKPLDLAEYENCSFTDCNFSGTDLSDIFFVDCVFESCDLSNAKLNETAFRTVRFKHCKLLGLHFDDCNAFLLSLGFDTCVLNYSIFFKLKLKNTHFENCRLEEVDFTETDLSNAIFGQCDLQKAVFENTNLQGADLRTAYNFSIDPEQNRIKKAKFSAQNIVGLLDRYDITVTQ